MSNLLDFQHSILEEGQAVLSIEKQQLNPDHTFEETGVSESFDKSNYDNSDLRSFINDNSKEITKYGNFIKGQIKKSKVILSVVKIK